MAWTGTTAEVITSVRLRGRIPDGDTAMSPTEITLIANEVIQDTVGPVVYDAREEHGVVWSDRTIVADQALYRLPDNASGHGLRDLTLIDSNGDGVSLPRIPLEDADHYASGGSGYWPHGAGFCLEGGFVRLLPNPDAILAGETLRMRFRRRPGQLVTAAEAATVVTVSGLSYNVDAVPGTWTVTTADVGPYYDLIDGNGGFYWQGVDLTATDVSDPVVFSATPGEGSEEIIQTGRTGSYIAFAGQSPVITLPLEAHPAVVTATLVRVLDALGHAQRASLQREQLQRQMAELPGLLTPRVDGEDPRILNWHSPLRGGRYRWSR